MPSPRVGGDEKTRRRLAVQVGTPRAIEDLDTIVSILSLREVLADLARRLPSQLRTFEREQIDPVQALARSGNDAAGLGQGSACANRTYFVYGLILVMNRLAAPWQLVRIATRAAESDDPVRIAETPYAVAVTIVLGEAENMVAELRAEIKAGHPVASMLKDIHDTARETTLGNKPVVRFAVEPAIGGDPQRRVRFAEIGNRDHAGQRAAFAAAAPGQGYCRRVRCLIRSMSTRPRCGSNSSARAGITPASSPSAK